MSETVARNRAVDDAHARADAAWFPLDRALLVATGPQRQKFLHGLLSHDVQGRSPGQGCRAALMDARGHLLALLRVSVADTEVILELPADRRDEVRRLLDHYKVAAPVRFATSEDAVVGLVGPRALEALRALDPAAADLPPESHQLLTLAGTRVRAARAGDLPLGGWVLHLPAASRDAIATALQDSGVPALKPAALDALRIEEGRAWYGRDVTRDNLLHETGLVSEYHSPTKGCYVGQEVVARLEARGANVNRRLRGLRLSEARPHGAMLRADDKEVGGITTAAVSSRLGPIAMGYVHRAQSEPGTVLDADGARAEVVALPMPYEP